MKKCRWKMWCAKFSPGKELSVIARSKAPKQSHEIASAKRRPRNDNMFMQKYLTLFSLSWQRHLEVRSDFFFERIRSLSIMVSLYFLWSALISYREGLLGYTRQQLLTYVLVMTLLRAFVLACVTDRIPTEISRGKISDILLRPLSYMGFWATQDAANKSLNLISAILEVLVFTFLVSAPFFVSTNPLLHLAFIATTLGAMVLYFQMSFLLGVMGFWTAQSWGPRFCFEIILEFCAGAYFPIDFLPRGVQLVLSVLPFPYLIFYPLSIYLGKATNQEILMCFLMQAIWIGFFVYLNRVLWRKGLKVYGAEGR